MGRYPKAARAASLKCIACNAPVASTVDDRYVCVECGESPIESRSDDAADVDTTAEDAAATAEDAGFDRQTATDD